MIDIFIIQVAQLKSGKAESIEATAAAETVEVQKGVAAPATKAEAPKSVSTAGKSTIYTFMIIRRVIKLIVSYARLNLIVLY